MVADPTYGGKGLKKPSKNALQNHCRRSCRKILNSWVEYGRRDEPHRTEIESIENLTTDNIVLNTVLNRCPDAPHRLAKFKLVRDVEDGMFHKEPLEVTADNIFQTTVPFDHFMDKDLGDPDGSVLNEAMKAAWELLLTLQERTHKHGVDNWSKLSRSCLPVTWFDRTSKKSVANDTYDGGCNICTYKPQERWDALELSEQDRYLEEEEEEAAKRQRTLEDSPMVEAQVGPLTEFDAVEQESGSEESDADGCEPRRKRRRCEEVTTFTYAEAGDDSDDPDLYTERLVRRQSGLSAETEIRLQDDFGHERGVSADPQ